MKFVLKLLKLMDFFFFFFFWCNDYPQRWCVKRQFINNEPLTANQNGGRHHVTNFGAKYPSKKKKKRKRRGEGEGAEKGKKLIK